MARQKSHFQLRRCGKQKKKVHAEPEACDHCDSDLIFVEILDLLWEEFRGTRPPRLGLNLCRDFEFVVGTENQSKVVFDSEAERAE
jgi:hypothetical protein